MSSQPIVPARSVAELVRAADASIAPEFAFFRGHRSRRGGGLGPFVLSQWYPAGFAIDGIRYPTAEHDMMAEKARLFGDRAVLAGILASEDPSDPRTWRGSNLLAFALMAARAALSPLPR